MKALLNILGGLFLIIGIIWIIAIVVAVANHNPDYSKFTQLIVPFIIHAVCNLVGIILIGLARRFGKNIPAGNKGTAQSAWVAVPNFLTKYVTLNFSIRINYDPDTLAVC